MIMYSDEQLSWLFFQGLVPVFGAGALLSILMAPTELGPAILASVLGGTVSFLVNLLAMQNER